MQDQAVDQPVFCLSSAAQPSLVHDDNAWGAAMHLRQGNVPQIQPAEAPAGSQPSSPHLSPSKRRAAEQATEGGATTADAPERKKARLERLSKWKSLQAAKGSAPKPPGPSGPAAFPVPEALQASDAAHEASDVAARSNDAASNSSSQPLGPPSNPAEQQQVQGRLPAVAEPGASTLRTAGDEPQAPVLVATNAPAVPDHLLVERIAHGETHSADPASDHPQQEQGPAVGSKGLNLAASPQQPGDTADVTAVLGVPGREGITSPCNVQQSEASKADPAQYAAAATSEVHLQPEVQAASAAVGGPGGAADMQSRDAMEGVSVNGQDQAAGPLAAAAEAGEADAEPGNPLTDRSEQQGVPSEQQQSKAEAQLQPPSSRLPPPDSASTTFPTGGSQQAVAASVPAAEPAPATTTSIKVADNDMLKLTGTNETLKLTGTFKPGKRPHGEPAAERADSKDRGEDKLISKRSGKHQAGSKSASAEVLPGPPPLPASRLDDQHRKPKDSKPSHGQDIRPARHENGSGPSQENAARNERRHSGDHARSAHRRLDDAAAHRNGGHSHAAANGQHWDGSDDHHRPPNRSPDREPDVDPRRYHQKPGKSCHTRDHRASHSPPPKLNGHDSLPRSEPHSAKRPRMTPFSEPPRFSGSGSLRSSDSQGPADKLGRRPSDIRSHGSGSHRSRHPAGGASPRKSGVQGADYYDDSEPGMGGDLYNGRAPSDRHRNGRHELQRQPHSEDRWGMEDGLPPDVQIERSPPAPPVSQPPVQRPLMQLASEQPSKPALSAAAPMQKQARELSPGELPSSPSAGDRSPDIAIKPSVFARIARL